MKSDVGAVLQNTGRHDRMADDVHDHDEPDDETGEGRDVRASRPRGRPYRTSSAAQVDESGEGEVEASGEPAKKKRGRPPKAVSHE
jgi:hypothetical protein